MRSYVLPFLGFVIVTAAIVPPTGDYPVVDDFFHARVVWETLAAGSYQPHPFIGSTFVLQALWGLPFAALFGENFVALRISTLVLAVAGMGAVAWGARGFGAPRWAALLAGATLWANPIFMHLSYSFMTDVPFFALIALSTAAYAMGFKADSARLIAVGTALGFAAFFVRQHGLGVVLAAWAAAIVSWVLYRDRLSTPAVLSLVLSSVTGCLIVYLYLLVYPMSETQGTWLTRGGEWTTGQRLKWSSWYVVIALLYMGLFALPLAAARIVQVVRGDERWSWTSWLGVAALAATLFAGSILLTRGMTRMPYAADYLYDMGVGNITFTGTSQEHENFSVVSVGKYWWIPTMAALGAGALLLRQALHFVWPFGRIAKEERPARRQGLFLLACLSAYIVGMLPFLPDAFNDRYMLPALAPALMFMARPLSRARGWWAKASGIAVLIALFFISLIMHQDYTALTKARWQAYDWLIEEQNADPLTIDGGYEYNGVYTMDEYVRRHDSKTFWDMGVTGYWLLHPEYAVDLVDRHGYEEIRRVPYFSWLGLETRAVRVFRKIG